MKKMKRQAIDAIDLEKLLEVIYPPMEYTLWFIKDSKLNIYKQTIHLETVQITQENLSSEKKNDGKNMKRSSPSLSTKNAK